MFTGDLSASCSRTPKIRGHSSTPSIPNARRMKVDPGVQQEQQATRHHDRNETRRHVEKSHTAEIRKEKTQAAMAKHARKEFERRNEAKGYMKRQRLIICGTEICPCTKNVIHRAATERLDKMKEMRSLVDDVARDVDSGDAVRVLDQVRRKFEDLELSSHSCKTVGSSHLAS